LRSFQRSFGTGSALLVASASTSRKHSAEAEEAAKIEAQVAEILHRLNSSSSTTTNAAIEVAMLRKQADQAYQEILMEVQQILGPRNSRPGCSELQVWWRIPLTAHPRPSRWTPRNERAVETSSWTRPSKW
jgi:hypothetical protein